MARRVLERRDRYETEQKQRHQRICRRVTTGVCAFMVVFVGLSAWLTVDTKARAYVKALWEKTINGEWTTYTFTPSGTFTGFPDVELTWLPEGYELAGIELRTDEQRDMEWMSYSYRNDEKGTEFFLYITSIEDMPVRSYKPFKSMEVSVNGQKAEYLYVENDKGVAWGGFLMWVDAQRVVQYELRSGLVRQGFTVDDLVKIAEGLVVVG